MRPTIQVLNTIILFFIALPDWARTVFLALATTVILGILLLCVLPVLVHFILVNLCGGFFACGYQHN